MEKFERGEWYDLDVYFKKITLVVGRRKDGGVKIEDNGNSLEMVLMYSE